MPLAFQVRLAGRAQLDIEAIRAFIALDSPLDAQRFIAGLIDAIDSLEHFPLRHPAAHGAMAARKIRSMGFSNYRVLYRVHGNDVLVLRIRHGARMEPRE